MSIRQDGTFTLRVWTPPSESIVASVPGLSGLNITAEGIWHSESELIFLTSGEYRPDAHVQKTRESYYPNIRHNLQQQIILTLRSNGELSQLGDHVHLDSHASVLNTQRRNPAR